MSAAKFPRPWRVARSGEDSLSVFDANDALLFHIMGDEGDGDEAPPSALYWSADKEDTEYLIDEIIRLFDDEEMLDKAAEQK